MWACLVCGTELCGRVWYVGLNCVGVSGISNPRMMQAMAVMDESAICLS